MKKLSLLFCLLLFSTLSFGKNPVNAYKDLKSGKKDEALKSFLEINKKDSATLIANYALALLYSDSHFDKYNLELSYRYSNIASRSIDCNSIQGQTNICTWNKTVCKSDLKDIEKIKIEPSQVQFLKDSILASVFDNTIKNNTIAGFKQFLKDYPESKQSQLAKQSICRVAFDNAVNIHTISGYEQFIKEYPDASQVKGAKEMISALAFRVAKEKNTIEAYSDYILKYPNSSKREEAKEKVDELAFIETKQKNTKEAYEKFIDTYPEAKQIQEAKDKLHFLSTDTSNSYCVIVEPKYDDISFSDKDELIQVFQNGKCGFIDKTGKEVIPLIYDEGNDREPRGFSEGLAAVKKNDKWGFIDKSGQVVISIQYDYCENFYNNLALVGLNSKIGFINKAGKVIIPLKYNAYRSNGDKMDGSSFHLGLAKVILNNELIFIDTIGNIVVSSKSQWDEIYDFKNGLSKVEKGGKYGLIDKSGKIITPIIYDEISDFNEGLAAVGINDKWGFINKQGKVIIPLQFDYCQNFSEAMARVNLNSKMGYIDKTGKVVIPIQYHYAADFSNGTATVELNGENSEINKIGKVVAPLKRFDKNIYEHVNEFSEDLAVVKLNNKYGFIDKTGKIVIPIALPYDMVFDFHNNIAAVCRNKKWGYINKLGKEVIPLIFDYVDCNSNSKVKTISLNEKFGFIGRCSYDNYINKDKIIEGIKNQYGINTSENKLNTTSIDKINNNNDERVERKAKYILKSFTEYTAYAEDEDNLYKIEISHAEMDESNSKNKLILSGKMYHYIKYKSSNNTPMGQVISLATGNAQIVAVEKVVFYCPKSELAKDWSKFDCEGYFSYTKIKVNIEWLSLTMHTRLIVSGKDYALKLSN